LAAQLLNTVARVASVHRNFHKISIRQMPIAVGEGKLLSLNHPVQGLGVFLTDQVEVEAFKNLEHFKSDESLRGRRQFINIVISVMGADRLDPIRVMFGKIFEREKTAELFRATLPLEWRCSALVPC
jgi:hypothetical protein